jgi:amino acid permease
MLKNLKVLAPFSILGIAGMVGTVVAMTVRCFDGTYAETGQNNKMTFLTDLPETMRPSFGTVGMRGVLRPQVFNLLCMLATAYVAHYNSPRFYIELKDNSIPRFNRVVVISYVSSAAIYVVIAAVGFLTFGANSSEYILNNYSTRDMLATFCRISIAMSISFTYPIVFVGVRDGIIDLLKVPADQRTAFFLNILSTLILSVLTVMAATFTDLGMVLALGGATFGTAVIYIFPSLMFRAAVNKLGKDATDAEKQEAKLVAFLMWFGIAIGAIDTMMAAFGGFSE